MDHPYIPPATDPFQGDSGVPARKRRLDLVVGMLGGSAIVFGIGLMVFIRRFAFEFRLGRDNFPAGFPGFLRSLVNEHSDYPVWAGIFLGSVALLVARFGRLTRAFVIALLAVGIVGGWAGVLLAVISHWVRNFGR